MTAGPGGSAGLTWGQIVRLGLVQACLGALVVLMTGTLNRLMTVEMALPAAVSGALVALHYGVQITRPAWGLQSDTQGRRTRFIIGGMAVLAAGAWLAALAVTLVPAGLTRALVLSVAAYGLIGLGVGAAGTSMLALLARATDPRRRAAAATITWLMMIAGIAVTAGVTGALLDPYSPARLLTLIGTVAVGAVAVTTLAVWGIEARTRAAAVPDPAPVPLRRGLAEVWAEPAARRFTLFVLLAMTAYFMQELILEPYAGLVHGLTPGQTTQLSGAQNGGTFLGMLAVGIAATGLGLGSLRSWLIGGCAVSAAALAGLALLPPAGAALVLPLVVLLGAAAADLLRLVLPVHAAFGTVFLAEAALFLAAAALGAQVIAPALPRIKETAHGL